MRNILLIQFLKTQIIIVETMSYSDTSNKWSYSFFIKVCIDLDIYTASFAISLLQKPKIKIQEVCDRLPLSTFNVY